VSLGARASLAAALAALAAASCRPAPSPAPPPAEARAAARPRVTLESPSGRSTPVDVEVARTPAEQERGLMFRERLAPGTGMLFVFPASQDHVFWMRNTLVSLDMIFVDEKGVVVGVVERAEPLSEAGRSVGMPSRYVLEVPGGFAAEHGVRPGDRARLEGI